MANGTGKTSQPSAAAVDSTMGIGGKTISSVNAFRTGSVDVLDILCTDSNHYYIKFSQGKCDVGGTTDWGTGTMVGGR